MISPDLSSLSPKRQQEYVQLIRKGDSQSIAEASVLLPSAPIDSGRVHELLQRLSSYDSKKIERGNKQVAAIDKTIDSINREIQRLYDERDDLTHKKNDLQNGICNRADPKNDQVVLTLAAGITVRTACRPELEKSGFFK